ncbi:uncharacterized protein LOC113667285 [Pocillopora damicornis]|uniref:uncharacterized protein LOC113667285 n=1 Tax=Pocillopora damicornis TaxID=46731 RepID=UPI000F556DF9|nr:uncharacterized protein LOC113667285 [Pocillopora damicornis]
MYTDCLNHRDATSTSAKGVIVGAVVGSIAALAVAAGIFVFLVWKSRKRNSNNSNVKRERTNGDTTEEIGLAVVSRLKILTLNLIVVQYSKSLFFFQEGTVTNPSI